MGAGVQWNPVADVLLGESWLEVSSDPIVGTGQEAAAFWDRVAATHERLSSRANKGGSKSTIRSASACMNRWQTLNRLINKFVGIYMQLTQLPKSGWNQEMYYDEAAKVYQVEVGKAFAHKQLWLLVKDHPKWSSNKGKLRDEAIIAAAVEGKKKKKQKLADETAISEVADDADFVVVGCADEGRPIGNKAAKQLAKGEKKYAATQLDVDRKAAEASETKAAALQLQAATVRDELNYKIFALDPTNPLAKQWLQLKMELAVKDAERERNELERQQRVEEERAKKETKVIKRASFNDVPELPAPQVVDELVDEGKPTNIEFVADDAKDKPTNIEITDDGVSLSTGSGSTDEGSSGTTSNKRCAADTQCYFFNVESNTIDDDGLKLRSFCNKCKNYCHTLCCEHKGMITMCSSCLLEHNKHAV